MIFYDKIIKFQSVKQKSKHHRGTPLQTRLGFGGVFYALVKTDCTAAYQKHVILYPLRYNSLYEFFVAFCRML